MATLEKYRYLLMTLDPVHVGTGGYRLGRVDNSIVREPGTRVPKIPGTAIHGAVRSYAARLYGTLEAAGKDHDRVDNPASNPVCYTFGYAKGLSPEGEETPGEVKTEAYSGVVNVFDAQIVLFPVHSMYGPVWVSTRQRLKNSGFTINSETNNPEPEPQALEACLTSWDRTNPLNLGWLMLPVGGKATIEAPTKWQGDCWQEIKDRLVLVSEGLFSQVVNSNLEVRTSVSIDPWRGAAEDKALFTYEALPRATFLTLEIVVDDYREAFPPVEQFGANNLTWENPADVFNEGLDLLAWLGVGGMGTRGFGRLTRVGDPVLVNPGEEPCHE